MKVQRWKCPNCVTEFVVESVLYCPFCGTPLQKQGLADYSVKDYITAGWNAIAFRGKPGFIVKGIQDRSQL